MSSLVFDLGTTNFKAGLIDDTGTLSDVVRFPTPIVATGNRREISHNAFWQAIRSCTTALGTRRDLRDVSLVTFSTQANTFTLLDDDGDPLTPLIAWTDERADGESFALESLTRDPDYVARSGVPSLSCHFAAAKVAWFGRHDPALLARARRLCFLGDYLIERLTGMHATDGSIAALSGLYDVAAGRWDDAWCTKAGVPIALLPTILPAGQDLGVIRPEAARELGLSTRCRVAMGLLDQYAGAIGMGSVLVGGVSETTGTVLATLRCSDRFDAVNANSVYRGPAGLPGRFFHMAFGDIGGSLVECYRTALTDSPSLEALDALVTPGSASTLSLDVREPIEALRATIRSWADTKPRGEVMSCIYRAVATALAAQLKTIDSLSPQVLYSGGGGARSRKWLQIKADVLGCPVLAPSCEEPNLIGAAIVAGAAAPRTSIDYPADRLILPRKIRIDVSHEATTT